MTIWRRTPRRQPLDSEEEKRQVDEHDRADEAARKRAELKVLRRIAEVGWWWPDGS